MLNVTLLDRYGKVLWSSKTQLIGMTIWDIAPDSATAEHIKTTVGRCCVTGEVVDQTFDVQVANDRYRVAVAAWPVDTDPIAIVAITQRIPCQLCSLTARERELVRLLPKYTIAQIAKKLHVSKHTVATHLRRARTKLECASHGALIAFAIRHAACLMQHPSVKNTILTGR